MKAVAVAVTAAWLMTAVGAACSQSYPSKPVRLVMGPPTGGPTDGVGRVITARLSEIWGQQVGNIRAGKVRARGVTSSKRSARVPEVPTIAESGVPGFELTVWYGMCAPAAVPKSILSKVAADVLNVIAMPAVRQRLADQEVDVEPMDSGPFAAFIQAETVKWAKVVKDAGIQPQ